MRPNVVIPGVVALAALVSYGLGGYAAWSGMVSEGRVGPALSLAFLGVAFVIALGAGILHLRLVQPLDSLAKSLRTQAQTPVDKPLEVKSGHLLGSAVEAAERAVEALRTARGQSRAAIESATKRADEQKNRLEAILLDLSEGVIVCNLQHRILLYNQAAARILQSRGALGLDRSLFGLLTREPVVQVLDEMLHAADPWPGTDQSNGTWGPVSEKVSRRFVCSSVDLGTLLQTRLSLIREAPGRASGYVLTFADVSEELEKLAMRDALLREVAVEWRRPLANLRAAAEMLTENDDIEPDERRVFEEIVAKEVNVLNKRFAEVADRYEQLADGPWPLSDIYSLDLFRTIAKHLHEKDIRVTPIGIPLWVLADGYSLVLALEHLIRAVSTSAGITSFDIEARPGGQYAYIEIIWDGEPLPLTIIGSWLREPLVGTIGSRTVTQIVERHGGDLWSQRLDGGRSCLRLPLRPSARPPSQDLDPQVPRPEYYDFELLFAEDSALEDVPLRKMNFVVFDTETTGLQPTDGDELLSIGAVRVVNGRILTGETFDRLINPGREIPKTSTKIHGITPEAVAGRPPAEVVLPQFKDFVQDTVLVAYNAAFDMKFLEMKEARSGVRFDNPVLDAQLLSIYAQPDEQNHSLNAIAHQLGLEVIARHTAVGDALTTAAVFVKMLDLLEAKGVTTFGQAVKISSQMMEQRKRNSPF